MRVSGTCGRRATAQSRGRYLNLFLTARISGRCGKGHSQGLQGCVRRLVFENMRRRVRNALGNGTRARRKWSFLLLVLLLLTALPVEAQFHYQSISISSDDPGNTNNNEVVGFVPQANSTTTVTYNVDLVLYDIEGEVAEVSVYSTNYTYYTYFSAEEIDSDETDDIPTLIVNGSPTFGLSAGTTYNLGGLGSIEDLQNSPSTGQGSYSASLSYLVSDYTYQWSGGVDSWTALGNWRDYNNPDQSNPCDYAALAPPGSSDTVYIGNGGAPEITSSSVAESLTIDQGSSLKLLDGSLTISDANEIVGYNGDGAFIQTGGSNIAHDESPLVLGWNAGSHGTYTMSGGIVSLTSIYTSNFTWGTEIVGLGGDGTFNQSGGAQSMNQSLVLGSLSDSSGVFNLMAGSLSVLNDEFIGGSGTGDFVQTGGTNLTAENIFLGYDDAESQGTYAISNGVLSVGGQVQVGVAGTGLFNQNGGSVSADYIQIGCNTGATGQYNLYGGSVNAPAWIQVGYSGTASFAQSGGAVSVGGIGIFLGSNSGGTGSGTYSLSGQGSLMTAYDNVCSGTFSQFSGTHSVTNNLLVGVHAGLSGTYSLSGGTVTVSGSEYVGLNGNGTFTQTGGTNTVAGSVTLAANSGSTGTYELLGGTLSVSNSLIINAAGTMTGNGVVGGSVINGGFVVPGNPFGALSVNGNYSETQPGALNVTIGGPVAGSQYSEIAVTGLATLRGVLNIAFTNGFSPLPGQQFTILSCGARNGTFSEVNGATATNGVVLVPTYTATSIILVAVQELPPTVSVYPPVLSQRTGDHLAFLSIANGYTPSTYQWYFNNAVLSGQTLNRLVLTNIEAANEGIYWVLVNNGAGAYASNFATLEVSTQPTPLAATNLVVVRIGDGAQALSGATGNTVYLDQYTTSGAYVSTIQVPDESAGGNYGAGSSASVYGSPALLLPGTGNDYTSSGLLTVSANQQFLTFAGYCANYPFAGADLTIGATGSNSIYCRGLASVDAYGSYRLTYTNGGLYSGSPHSVRGTTTLDGTNFWTTGQAGSSGGIKYINTQNTVYNGGVGIPTLTNASLTGSHSIQIFGPNLMYSDALGPSGSGLYICSGTPEPGPGGTATSSLLLKEGGQPNDFAVSPDMRTIYIADGQAFSGASSQAGGIERWDSATPGTNYTFSYTLQTLPGTATNGAQGLAASFPSTISTWGPGISGAALYATSFGTNTNSLVQIIDTGPNSAATVLVTAGPNEALRGLRFGLGTGPQISIQPTNRVVNLNSSVNFSIAATGTSALGYQWLFNGVPLADSGQISGSRSNVLTLTNVTVGESGTYEVIVSNAFGEAASTASLTVTPANPTVTWVPNAMTYGTALTSNQLNATANVPGNFAYNPPLGTVLNAGPNPLSTTFTPSDPVDYSSVTNNLILLVNPAPLTVTCDSTNRPYGQANPVFTGTLTGLVNNDNITATFSCSATSNSLPGIYVIQPTLLDPDNRLTNYVVTTKPGTLTILVSFVVLNLMPGPGLNAVRVTFDRPVNATVLNLHNNSAPTNFFLVGTNTGPVAGSLIVQGNIVTFVKTGAPLSPDTYTLRLVSATNGFQDLYGNLLDGNGDQVPGDDYVGQLVITPSSNRVLSLPDFARAAGQPVNIPATNSGIPLTLSEGSDVTAVSFGLQYDTNLLMVSGISFGASVPGSWTMTNNLSVPGNLQFSAGGTASLLAGTNTLATIQAQIPWCAPYGAAGILNLNSAQLNGGAIPAAGDSSVEVIALVGDADGNGFYGTNDSSIIGQFAVGQIAGFAAYPLIDPTVIGNISAESPPKVSAFDAELVAEFVAGNPPEAIPVLPTPLVMVAGSNQVTISWPQCMSSYILEQSSSLGPQAIWTQVTNIPVPVGNLQTISAPLTGSVKFYRLSQP